MIKHEGVLSILERAGKDTTAVKILGITNLVEQSFYLSSEEGILLMIQVAEAFVKTD